MIMLLLAPGEFLQGINYCCDDMDRTLVEVVWHIYLVVILCEP